VDGPQAYINKYRTVFRSQPSIVEANRYGVVIALIWYVVDKMVVRKAPLQSGRDTEIDMIERQMLGGVVVLQPLEVHEHSVKDRLGGLVEIEEGVETRPIRSRSPAAPKA
jgi:hypothetical protein